MRWVLCRFLGFLKSVFAELECFRLLVNFNLDVLNTLGNVTWNVGVYVGLL